MLRHEITCENCKYRVAMDGEVFEALLLLRNATGLTSNEIVARIVKCCDDPVMYWSTETKAQRTEVWEVKKE